MTWNAGILSHHYLVSEPEDKGSKVLRHFGILPHHYMVWQPDYGGTMVLRNGGILLHHHTASKPERTASSHFAVSIGPSTCHAQTKNEMIYRPKPLSTSIHTNRCQGYAKGLAEYIITNTSRVYYPLSVLVSDSHCLETRSHTKALEVT
jgi:hypothetical protein